MFFKKREQYVPDDQAVIITLNLKSIGENEVISLVHELENKIENVIPDDAELDGDEFGDGEATIYIYGQSADDIFVTIEDLLKKSVFDSINILLRYGSVTDMNAKEKIFTL